MEDARICKMIPKFPIVPREKTISESLGTEPIQNNEINHKVAISNSVEIEILKYMITNKKLFGKVLSALEDVGGKVDILTERVQQLTNNIPEEVINVRSFTDTFPLNNKEQLLEMEKCLAEAAMRNNLVTFLAKEGGTSYKEVIRRIMSKTLTNELAVSFSWKGWKAKEEFSKYILAGVIEAVEKNKSATTRKEIELQISIWLAKATERIKNKKYNE